MDMFSALADTNRRHIIELLARNGQLPAGDIYNQFALSHPAISQHLKVLKDAKIVKVEKKAQQRIYTINAKALHEIEDWVDKIGKLWEARYDRLDKVLAAEKRNLKHGR